MRRDCRRFERGIARRPAQRQAPAGPVERSTRCRETAEDWRPRGTNRSAVVGDRGLAGAGAAIRREAPVKAGRSDCDAASTRGRNGRRGGAGDRVAAPYRSRCLFGYPEEEARVCPCFGPRGTRPGLPHRRAGECMTLPSTMRRLASTLAGRRPLPIKAATGATAHESRALSEIETEIAGLPD